MNLNGNKSRLEDDEFSDVVWCIAVSSLSFPSVGCSCIQIWEISTCEITHLMILPSMIVFEHANKL